MSTYPFSYCAIVYYHYDTDTNEHKYLREQGMGFADSFTKAASLVENYYGSDLIRIENLELYEESDLLLMPQEHIDAYRERNYGPDVVFKHCDINGRLLIEDYGDGVGHHD